MHFCWNEQTERWFADASDYTGYSEKLAQILLAQIPERSSLCDIGCGLGLSDLVMAQEIGEVTCADISEYATKAVARRAAARSITNITAVTTDGMKLSGQWDTVMALFHAELEQVCARYLSLARDRFLFVTHGSLHGQTGPKKYRTEKCCDVDLASAWLDTHAVVYTLEKGSLEFGQPQRNLEDAMDFHRTYCSEAPEDELRQYVHETVIETGRTDFPYYTPKQRSFGLFVIRRADNESFLSSLQV